MFADALGEESYRGYQIEDATLSFRFIGTEGSDSAELEVLPTLEEILAGAVNLTVDILEALGVTEITIHRIRTR